MVGGALEVSTPDGRRALLPAGTRFQADRSVEWFADTLIAGGSPWKLMRLTDQGAGLVAQWLDGRPLSGDPAAGALARRLVDGGLLHPARTPRAPQPGEIDLVVPVRDAVEQLEALLQVVSTPGIRVVVVDDGSSDGPAHARVAEAHGATIIRRATPGGPAAARNAGLTATSAPLVAFLDVDVLPCDDWIERLVPYFDDPAVALAAPRVIGRAGATRRERFEVVASPLDLGDQPAVARPGAAVPYVPAAAIVVRRTAVADGFDETLRIGEDVDLCWRLHAAGWQVRYVPSARAEHLARATWAGWVLQRVRYGASAAPLEARHGDAAAPLRADPRILATLALAAWGRPRAALALLSWSGGSLARQLDGIAVRGGGESAARQLAVRGTALAAPGIARSAFRSYGPLLVAAAVAVPAIRRPVVVLGAAATATRWWRAGKPEHRLAFGALSVADDLCYGAGVLVGAARARRLGALRPRLRPTAASPAISRT
jgi:mycofactocin system glycosyltransferase